MTILFSDLVDSTVLAGRLEPEAMRDIYRMYRDAAQQAVDRFGGFVLQYLGDGIVATFGYPTAHEDDARRAVHAGLALITGLEASAEAGRAALPRGAEGAGRHPHRARGRFRAGGPGRPRAWLDRRGGAQPGGPPPVRGRAGHRGGQ